MAFIGDAVHTLYIRERIVEDSDGVMGTLHTAASRFASAVAQAVVYERLVSSGMLTDEEADVGRRARNAHLHSRAKTASSTEYHKATALEAVIGYVHVGGDKSREKFLLDTCYALGMDAQADK